MIVQSKKHRGVNITFIGLVRVVLSTLLCRNRWTAGMTKSGISRMGVLQPHADWSPLDLQQAIKELAKQARRPNDGPCCFFGVICPIEMLCEG